MRSSALLVGLVIALTTLGAGVLQQLSPTPAQNIERDIGTYDYAITVPVSLPPGDREGFAAIGAATTRLDSQGAVGLVGFELPVDGAPAGVREQYREFHWDRSPAAARYRLEEGRWPVTHGEVSVTAASGLAVGDEVSLFSGQIRIKVTGVASDRFERSAWALFGTPGTWASWRIPELAERYPFVLAAADVHWSGTSPEEALPELDATVKHIAETNGRGPVVSPDRAMVKSREGYLERQRQIAALLLPVVGLAPLVLLPGAAGLAAGALLSGWNARTRGQLFSLGIATRSASTAIAAATLCASTVGVLAGVAAGLVLTAIVRAPLAASADYELAPWRPWGGLLALQVTLAVVGSVAGLVVSPTMRTVVRSIDRLGRLRRPVAGVAAIVLATRMHGPHDGLGLSVVAVLVALVLSLLAPDALSLWVARRTERPPAALARRLLHGRPGLVGVVVATLTMVQATLCLGMSTAVSQVAAANAELVASVPPGHLRVDSLSDHLPVPPSVRQRVEQATGYQDPIVTRSVPLTDFPPDFQGSVGVFDDIAALEAWLGHSLTTEQRDVLATGVGLLATDDVETVRLPLPATVAVVPAVRVHGPRELTMQFGALSVRSAPFLEGVTLEHEVLHYRADPADIARQAPTLAAEIGIDASYIGYHKEPRPYQLAESMVWAILVFTALAVVLLCAAVAALSRGIRPYLASLAALGVPGSWQNSLVTSLVTPLVMVPALLVLIALAAGSGLVWASSPEHYLLTIPAEPLGAAAAITAVGWVMGAFTARWRLSVRERRID